MGDRIVVVTDSTANLPPAVVKELDIPIIPLNIHWSGADYLDGVTLDADTFYQWLGTRPENPTTSQPSVGSFIQFFKDVAARYETNTLVGVFISGKLSGTFSAAIQARAELPELRIELIDSQSASMGLGFQVLAGVRAVQAGAALPEVLARIEAMQRRMQVLFVVDTLDYLHRGGRIGGAAHFFGTMLNLKPLLTLSEGRIEAVDKVRGRRKSLQRLLELAEARAGGRPLEEIAVLSTGNSTEDMEWLVARVQEKFRPRRIHHTVVTPVIGAHTGPGTSGLIFPGPA